MIDLPLPDLPASDVDDAIAIGSGYGVVAIFGT
jgi:hypothetical protein